MRYKTYLVKVDGGLPELLLGLVEVTHTDLTEVTGVVLVQAVEALERMICEMCGEAFHSLGTVVVLTTGHTTTTGRLAVLADTTVTCGDVAAAVRKFLLAIGTGEVDGDHWIFAIVRSKWRNEGSSYALRVLLRRVGTVEKVDISIEITGIYA